VIGDPVRHSLSPAIFNAAFRAAGVDWVFVAFEVAQDDTTGALAAMRTLDLAGLSVTMPHKTAVADHVDECSPDARALRAVNTVRNDGGRLVGDNTDGAGFVRALREEAELDPVGRCCVVLGAGGAARAVVLALARAGASDVVVVNRTAERAEVAAALAGDVGRVGSFDDIAAAGLLVNATPVGMSHPSPDATPVDPALLHDGLVVADLVYQPSTTALLAAARARGLVAVNGLGMLVHQAALQFEWWTGRAAPLPAMFEAAASRLGHR
jgi:shikimate dehydrogenase